MGGKERYKANETIGLGRDVKGKKSALLTARLGGDEGNKGKGSQTDHSKSAFLRVIIAL